MVFQLRYLAHSCKLKRRGRATDRPRSNGVMSQFSTFVAHAAQVKLFGVRGYFFGEAGLRCDGLAAIGSDLRADRRKGLFSADVRLFQGGTASVLSD
jgi:hypothetical protein